VRVGIKKKSKEAQEMPLNQVAEVVKPPVNELILGELFKEARRLLTNRNITFEQLTNELQSLIFKTIELSCGNITSKNIRARYVVHFGANRFWDESSNWFKKICKLPNAVASVLVYTTFLPFIRVEIFKNYKKNYLAKTDYEPYLYNIYAIVALYAILELAEHMEITTKVKYEWSIQEKILKDTTKIQAKYDWNSWAYNLGVMAAEIIKPIKLELHELINFILSILLLYYHSHLGTYAGIKLDFKPVDEDLIEPLFYFWIGRELYQEQED